MNQLLTVSLRQNAIFIPETDINGKESSLNETIGLLAANLSKLGYSISQSLLNALNNTTPIFQAAVLQTVGEVMGIPKNWTPLVKGWDIPTGETVIDHLITFFANIFKVKGTQLSCGHIIPLGTFPLERYNGCPFCGTPFEFSEIENYKQGSEQKVLELWTTKDVNSFLLDLLASKTALDATQMDSLKLLLAGLPLPEVKIAMKETLMAVVDFYRNQNQAEKAQQLFTSPTDILRYLWYKHTGFLQIIEPKTIVSRKANNSKHITSILDNSAKTKLHATAGLKLKYNRKDCLVVAAWLNNLELETAKMCEMMHSKRGMWVRFIRALRLAEYSNRTGFDKLKKLLDKFYKVEYEVWQANVNQFRLRYDAISTFKLLQQRPGLFARSLFANMLWFGSADTIAAFAAIIDKVPARLVFTLNMYAENYFDKTSDRVVKPLGGTSKHIPANRLLNLYEDEQLEAMKSEVAELCLLVMQKRFAIMENSNKTMYIDPMLFKIPVSIGDRSETIQDLPIALMGTRFNVNGDIVRLFMQWGVGLSAQHLDMDLSCLVAYNEKTEQCSISSLVVTGCKHSGDIRSIPNKIGTAEYIEINIQELKQAGAKYVSFTCNAYSNGSISPNLVVGWMNSKYKMKISETSGVAYDPSCVQHQVRVVNNLSKGLVFGVLDIACNEIIWLEMPFSGQLVQNLDTKNIEALVKKLDSKLSIGQLLSIKAEAQGLQLLETTDADEKYTMQWAQNSAAVTRLLVD